jgi:PAS domain S-box-containing protein
MERHEAEAILRDLAAVFSRDGVRPTVTPPIVDPPLPNLEAKYRTLVEQVPAVVFMAYLDRGIGEAYVSPRIEEVMGFTQSEWLEDPVRWYDHIHPEDRPRWSLEAAEMFLTGKPLRSAYRVHSRDGRLVWFQCEVKMVRRDDGRPWFIHGVGFDITELKQAEAALEGERNLLSAVLDTVGALVVVLSPSGAILRFNRMCEHLSGYSFPEVRYRHFWDFFPVVSEARGIRELLRGLRPGEQRAFESDWTTRDGSRRRIAWSNSILPAGGSAPAHVITTGIDITERKQMESALLEVGGRVQRRIGQDLHDGLGQHLTGIAFMSKVLQQQLAESGAPQAPQAGKIVRLVNDAIDRTRELARGLLPVFSEAEGLMSALQQYAAEVEDLFTVSCRFECPEPIPITDLGRATHLYHIAQEAVSNALKHGGPEHILISLSREGGVGTLRLEDDGTGLADLPAGHSGLGLRIMSYRATMVGGSLDIRRRSPTGTAICCRFPIEPEKES